MTDERSEANFNRTIFRHPNTHIEFLPDSAARFDFDLPPLFPSKKNRGNPYNIHLVRSLISHTVAALMREYISLADPVFHKKDLFSLRTKEMASLSAHNPDAHNSNLREAVKTQQAGETIEWYMHFMYFKFLQALHQREKEKINRKDTLPKESDGYAKAVLVGIVQSIKSWLIYYKTAYDTQEEIVPLLILLTKCKHLTEAEFPDAKKFIRPGFDE